MTLKSELYKKFTEACLIKKVNLDNAENTAVTVFFGVNKSSDLISQKSIDCYQQGESIVNRVLNTSNTKIGN